MCGIAGIVTSPGRLLATAIDRLGASLSHRGPDDADVFIDESIGIALAHRRLAILDLSAAARQPMRSRNDRYIIVFNGEIFNYLELRKALEDDGVLFSTSSDTEVLLEAVSIWGIDIALQRCIGMFAFAVFDREDQTLLLARDRVGEKPLVYFCDEKIFAFASELKGLQALTEFRRRLDPAAIDLYLSLGYIPAPACVFRNCYKLQPGHYMRVQKGEPTITRYWYPDLAQCDMSSSRAGRIGQLRALMNETVRIRLRADVPIALYLSGGIDSSVIASECVSQGYAPHAFTVVFDGDKTDLPYASTVAKKLGLRHDIVNSTGHFSLEEVDRMMYDFDEPFADSSCLPTSRLASFLRGRYKVVLTGDGGDEAFAGYRHYEHIGLKQLIKRTAVSCGLADGERGQPAQVYLQSKALFRASVRSTFLGAYGTGDNELRKLVAANPFLRADSSRRPLGDALMADRHVYLGSDLLFKADIALMSQGIEGRSPFLDHRVLEWAQRLPERELVSGRSKTVLLRDAYRQHLPAAVLDRQKHGFGAPIVSWLSQSFGDLIKQYLPTPLLQSRPQTQLLDSYFNGTSARRAQQVWALLWFAVWANRWQAYW